MTVCRHALVVEELAFYTNGPDRKASAAFAVLLRDFVARGYGHLFPDELQRLAERLQEAYTDAVADPARTESSGTMLGERKGAGQ
jgi:hypothetical protein